MPKTEPKRIVFQFAAELAIVVVGVLLAFQVDRWRDQNARSETESVHLSALKEDFESIKNNFESTLRQQKNVVRLSDFTLRVSMDPGMFSTAPPDSLRNAILFAIAWYDPEPIMGTYNALTASGDVGLLSDASLRRQLAEFYGQVSAGFEDRETTMDLVALMLAESKDHLHGVVASDWEGVLSWYNYTSISEADLISIFDDDGFLGLLSYKILLDGNKVGWLTERITEIDSIIATLDSQISK